MSRVFTSAVPLAVLAGFSLFSIGSGHHAQAAGTSDGTRCEFKIGKRSGMTTLEGVVASQAAISGSYRISVSSVGGGGSDIDQSGAFSAKPGQTVSLGVVSMGGTPGRYAADLTVTWNGGSTHCTEHVDGKI